MLTSTVQHLRGLRYASRGENRVTVFADAVQTHAAQVDAWSEGDLNLSLSSKHLCGGSAGFKMCEGTPLIKWLFRHCHSLTVRPLHTELVNKASKRKHTQGGLLLVHNSDKVGIAAAQSVSLSAKSFRNIVRY